MAGSFSVKFNGTITSNLHSDSFGSPNPVAFTQAAQGFHGETVIVGTTEEIMPTGDVNTIGYLYLRNLDTGNFVSWGPTFGGVMLPFGRLDPTGGEAWLRRNSALSAELRWKADTAPCKVQMKLFEA